MFAYKPSSRFATVHCNICDFVMMMQGSELYCERKVFPKRLPSDRKVAWNGSCGYWMDGIPF